VRAPRAAPKPRLCDGIHCSVEWLQSAVHLAVRGCYGAGCSVFGLEKLLLLLAAKVCSRCLNIFFI
jgi:hypothetical protein